jgi:CubicO group peptidase (beta-lactamase class C family)
VLEHEDTDVVETHTQDTPDDPSPDAPPRVSLRRRIVAWVVLACFALALAYPFFFWPRVRYFFSAVPAIRSYDEIHEAESRIIPPAAIDSAQRIVRNAVRLGSFPGGALAIGVRDTALLEIGIGRTMWGRLAPPVDPDETMYDLASLTKVVGTTTAVMILVDDGKMRLDDPVSRYLPNFTGGGREKVTIRHLLTHTAGLPAAVPLEGASAGDRLYHLVSTVKLISAPGENVLYSDVGFVVLGLAAASAAHQPLPAFLRKRVWEPLGMTSTRFEPGRPCPRCAPTLTLEDGSPFAGETNDPFSRKLGGITGNAGLFSTGHDMARFAQMLANGGALDGVRIVKEQTLREFEQPQPHAGTRALGFEWFCQEGTVPDQRACKTPYAFGHTGYTGTSMYIDPKRGIWAVLLTNRTYLPRSENQMRVIRRRIYNVITGTVVPHKPAQDSTAAADTAPETH